MISRGGPSLRRASLTCALVLMGVLAACGPMPDPGTTTTTSTTTTSSTTTSTTILGPQCEDYTPTDVTATPSPVPQGGVLTVSGVGEPGTTIAITLHKVGQGTLYDPGVTVVVPPDGHWSVQVPIPGDLAPGRWQVRAQVVGCSTFGSTEVTVRASGPTTTSTTTTTTSTTTTTTLVPNCKNTTPYDVEVSDDIVNRGQTIEVTGKGTPGTKVAITLRKVGKQEVVDTGVTTTVKQNGKWSAEIKIPFNISHRYFVRANVVGCNTYGSTEIVVLRNGQSDDDVQDELS